MYSDDNFIMIKQARLSFGIGLHKYKNKITNQTYLSSSHITYFLSLSNVYTL